MPEKGRLDAILGFHPDVLLMTERLGFEIAHFSIDYAIIDVPVSIICHENERNKKLINIINKRILAIHTNSKLQEFLGRHAISAPLTLL